MNPHRLLPEYDIAIWCDASVLLRKPLQALREELNGEHSLLFLKHPLRDCLYAEIDACKLLGKGNRAALDGQLARYHALIVMHAKHLCQKRAPACAECELRDRCVFAGQARG